MTDISLLPSSATDLQHALALTTAQATDLNHNIIRDSRDPLTCDAQLLPWQAWENSIAAAEGWDLAESEQEQRSLIAHYIDKHELKGTPYSIRKLFWDLNLGNIDIIENTGHLHYNGLQSHDGRFQYGGSVQAWATYYIVFLDKVPTNNRAKKIKTLLAELAPARCHLVGMHYGQNTLQYNNRIKHNATQNYGSYM